MASSVVGATTPVSKVLLALDVLLASRTVYGFLKSYFRWRLARQARREEAIREATERTRRPVRIYIDGCFDLMHFGHANALRQARALGDELYVGVCSDEEITRHKGPPVMSEQERYEAVAAVKWVDHVLPGVPYDVTPAFLDALIREFGIDYVVHGDDPCLGADGQDVYAAVKRAGHFRTIARTEGVSSTDIVGRMLLCTTSHHLPRAQLAGGGGGGDGGGSSRRAASARDGEANGAIREEESEEEEEEERDDEEQEGGRRVACEPAPQLSRQISAELASGEFDEDEAEAARSRAVQQASTRSRVSAFLPTTRRIMQFSSGRMPRPGDTVVYADGAWDMMSVAHVRLLKEARRMGDFVLVGIHDDATVNEHRGRNYPILNLHERTLSVLSCRYVAEVIIGAPWAVTLDVIRTMNISLVVHGTHHDELAAASATAAEAEAEADAYRVPKELGIYREIPSVSDLSVPKIIDRIVANRERYVERQKRKNKQEAAYYAQKEHVDEL